MDFLFSRILPKSISPRHMAKSAFSYLRALLATMDPIICRHMISTQTSQNTAISRISESGSENFVPANTPRNTSHLHAEVLRGRCRHRQRCSACSMRAPSPTRCRSGGGGGGVARWRMTPDGACSAFGLPAHRRPLPNPYSASHPTHQQCA